MISEGSCDTENWSNDAENSALITGINYIIKYIYSYLRLLLFYYIFDQINSRLESRRDFFNVACEGLN